jgi:hypothetical protein
MLLFKSILVAILLIYLTVCVAVFIYRKVVRLSYFLRSLGMIIFFGYTCHNFGLSWTTISLLYLSVCVLNLILRALFPSSSKTKSAGGYLTIESALTGRRGFSYSKFNGYSSASFPLNQNNDCHHEEERRIDLPNFSRLFLRVFVPLWLSYCLAVETINNSFSCTNSFYSFTFNMKNKIKTIFKNIKAA